ncbi:DUF2201 family putative metallopeptidase [Halomonas sp. C22]|uniref:DUF2201 family putative metallopeptidase n=1 Tax=Halomonas sp. C22 TaxID=2580567 RepID=UPI00054ABDB4|nr:hypothetical protein [Halomonas sp. C22]KHJ51910.1 hypothetical protein PZ78_06570 [Halomonas hydrothermalis]
MDPMTPTAVQQQLARQEQRKWEQDRLEWADSHPMMALLSECLTLSPLISQRFDTASTDGRHLYFSPDYSASLTNESRRFLHAHLIWHCMAGHLSAPLVAHRHRWHLACDHEVNALLLALDFPLPSNALLFPVCVGRSALDVYQWLEGHPDTSLESTIDVHPAALWSHLPGTAPDERVLALWRRRAHMAARETGTLPESVAKFCEAR